MKKTITILSVVFLSIAILAANGAVETETKATTSEVRPTLNEDGSFHLPIVDEPKTFTFFANMNNMPFNHEWPIWKEMEAKTGVGLRGVISQSNSNEVESFNLMLSSNELADVIAFSQIDSMEKLGMDGGLIPLNDLIDQYAPNIKAYMESHSAFKKFATALDGNIYFIPKDMLGNVCEHLWIRFDWLDKLGLEIPTTVDELHDVLYAFRHEDPNGNGLEDEIPLFDRAGFKMPDKYLYFWDSSTQFYFRDQKASYEPTTENFKYAVSNLIQWYKEGILDPEIFTRGLKARDILFSSDRGGCTHDWVSASSYNGKIDVPGFDIEAIPPVADQNGVVKERTCRAPSVGWGISSQCEDPVTLIKFFDYMFTPEGSDYLNWGIEGTSYRVDENGEKVFLIENIGDHTPVAFLRTLGCMYRVGFCHTGAYEAATRTEAGNRGFELYESHPEWYEDAVNMPPYFDGKLLLKVFPEDLVRYKRIMGTIEPYVNEKLQTWILGTANLEEDWDAFQAELKKRGIEEATEIVQRAYDWYMSN